MKKEPVKKPSHTGHRQRVFEKIKTHGFSPFYDYELLEFMLYAAVVQKDTKEAAKSLINMFGSLKGVLDATREEIKAAGFNDRVATIIESYKEVVYRYFLEANHPGEFMDTTQKAKDYIHALCLGKKVECVYCVLLDAQKRIINVEKLAEGSQDRAFIYLEELYRTVSIQRAKYIVIGHNHPSGYLYPSEDDLNLLEEINKGVMAVRAYIFDSIITCDKGAISLAEKGYIKDNQIFKKVTLYSEKE